MSLELKGKKDGKSFILQRQASWSTLRTKLVNAKMTDAFTNQKFTINGTTYTVLSVIGEGGYSKVARGIISVLKGLHLCGNFC